MRKDRGWNFSLSKLFAINILFGGTQIHYEQDQTTWIVLRNIFLVGCMFFYNLKAMKTHKEERNSCLNFNK